MAKISIIRRSQGPVNYKFWGSTGLFILAPIGVRRANFTGERNPSLSRGV
jgi:hypothetical protein